MKIRDKLRVMVDAEKRNRDRIKAHILMKQQPKKNKPKAKPPK